ncbi:DUF3558 family protein [Kutzneria kofuensis]|uniref:Uncharacterized protein YceK n=1 Tax=Kutzneria kofuensis TaxID=103725 RepID=A0A7W9NFR9_9PSEU|nr:DUF3558 family protein [Kutzneria kofuensis]MBB5890391.1 uncharacterized protein YceK [Kutzneria kofuensis]
MSWIRGAAVAAVALTLGGCGTTMAGQAEPVLGAQAKMKGPPDRDGDAVLTALRQLDACALLDGPAMAAAGLPPNSHPIPRGPHACSFSVDRVLDDSVDVMVGKKTGFAAKHRELPVTIAGAKAYLDDLTMGDHSECAVDIPVSFVMSIEVRDKPGFQSRTNSCDQAKAAAAGVIGKLGNPDSVTVPASRPLANWDGCSLLTAALPDLDPKKVRLEMDSARSPYDSCSASQDDGKGTSTSLGQVEVKYDSDPLSGANRTPRQVGDKTANVSDMSTSCYVEWGLGPSGSPDKLYDTVTVEVKLKGCDAATALAVKIQKALAGPAPTGGKPQRPLVYRPDEPDTDAVGACLDFAMDDGNCAPYQPFTLPASFAQWFPSTDDQPAIGCALAVDAVKEVFGDAFKPVVWGQHCFFVEPTHALTITIDVSTQYAPAKYGANPQLFSNVQTVAVSGKQAKAFTNTIHTSKPGHPAYDEYDVYVSPHNNIEQPGMIAGLAQARTPRGSNQDAVADVSKLHDLDKVMAKIIAKYVP